METPLAQVITAPRRFVNFILKLTNCLEVRLGRSLLLLDYLVMFLHFLVSFCQDIEFKLILLSQDTLLLPEMLHLVLYSDTLWVMVPL